MPRPAAPGSGSAWRSPASSPASFKSRNQRRKRPSHTGDRCSKSSALSCSSRSSPVSAFCRSSSGQRRASTTCSSSISTDGCVVRRLCYALTGGQTAIDVNQYLELPAFMLFCHTLCFALAVFNWPAPISPKAWPAVYLVLLVLILVNPLPILHVHARYWLIHRLVRRVRAAVADTRRLKSSLAASSAASASFTSSSATSSSACTSASC